MSHLDGLGRLQSLATSAHRQRPASGGSRPSKHPHRALITPIERGPFTKNTRNVPVVLLLSNVAQELSARDGIQSTAPAVQALLRAPSTHCKARHCARHDPGLPLGIRLLPYLLKKGGSSQGRLLLSAKRHETQFGTAAGESPRPAREGSGRRHDSQRDDQSSQRDGQHAKAATLAGAALLTISKASKWATISLTTHGQHRAALQLRGRLQDRDVAAGLS